MKKSHSDTPAIKSLVEQIRPLLEYTRELAREAEKLYALEVAAIITDQESDPGRIEHCLDEILGFSVDPVATGEYVYAYKDMWDNDD